jgi:predicted dehydrogenase
MGFKVGICGTSGFGSAFAPLFKAHPLCDELVLCDLRAGVLAKAAAEVGVARTYPSFDELCRSDVDAIAIFTQRWLHGPMAIQALKAGKHVYSAVPAASSVEELQELVETVRQTGLTYALGETSFYRPQTIFCRRRFAQGDFGRLVYGEGSYYHHMSHWFYRAFFSNPQPWQRFASVPPMWYATHSVAHVLGVTMSRFTHVSSFGFVDDHEDGVFDATTSAFGNPFSNQSALFRSADGGMARINEFRRSAAGDTRQTIIGTRGAYQEMPNPGQGLVTSRWHADGSETQHRESSQFNASWREVGHRRDPRLSDGSFDYVNAEHWFQEDKQDLTHLLRQDGVEITERNLGGLPRELLGRRHLDVTPLHEVERLPKEFVGLPNGHCGSHQFLVQDFFEAMATGKLPPNHVWLGARYIVPGIVAHESCKREGERLPIPDFGLPPADARYIDPLTMLKP